MNFASTAATRNTLRATSFRFGMVTILALLTACAGQPTVDPVADGTRIQLVTNESRIHMPNAESAGKVGKHAAAGAILGAGSGLGTGLMASITCGPLLVICLPALAAGGAAIGLVVGGTAGTISGAIIALPPAKANALDDIIEASISQSELPVRLRTEFERQGAGKWILSESQEDIVVIVEVQSIRIEQFEKDDVALHLDTQMEVLNAEGRTVETSFSYSSARQHIDYWLADEGRNFGKEIDAAYAFNVKQMVQTLSYGDSLALASQAPGNTRYQQTAGGGNQQMGDTRETDLAQPAFQHATLTDPDERLAARVETASNCHLTEPGPVSGVTIPAGKARLAVICSTTTRYRNGAFNLDAVAGHDYVIHWRSVDACIELEDVTGGTTITDNGCSLVAR